MMKKKEIVARYFDSVNDKPSGIRFEVLALELLADIRDGQNNRLDEIISLLKEIEYFERTKK